MIIASGECLHWMDSWETSSNIFWHYILDTSDAFLHIKRNDIEAQRILEKIWVFFANFSMLDMPGWMDGWHIVDLNGFYNKRRWNIMVGNWNNRKNKLLLSTTPQNYHTKLHLLQLFCCSGSNFSLLASSSLSLNILCIVKLEEE